LTILSCAGFVLSAALLAGEPVAAGTTLQLRGEFTIVVQAPPRVAVELFGAHGERAWAGKEWNPRFLDPLPAEDRAGAVFVFAHDGGRTILGFTPLFDREAGQVRHVFVRGSDSVTVIDVRLFPAETGRSRVVVVYERTALHRGAEAEVRALAAEDGAQAREWETAINTFLASTATSRP
jgi:hypothetical protein